MIIVNTDFIIGKEITEFAQCLEGIRENEILRHLEVLRLPIEFPVLVFLRKGEDAKI